MVLSKSLKIAIITLLRASLGIPHFFIGRFLTGRFLLATALLAVLYDLLWRFDRSFLGDCLRLCSFYTNFLNGFIIFKLLSAIIDILPKENVFNH